MSSRDRLGNYYWKRCDGSEIIITYDTDVSSHANTNQESELESAVTYFYLEESGPDDVTGFSRECMSVGDPEDCLEAFYNEVRKDLNERGI